jgi:hypothetical protein
MLTLEMLKRIREYLETYRMVLVEDMPELAEVVEAIEAVDAEIERLGGQP